MARSVYWVLVLMATLARVSTGPLVRRSRTTRGAGTTDGERMAAIVAAHCRLYGVTAHLYPSSAVVRRSQALAALSLPAPTPS